MHRLTVKTNHREEIVDVTDELQRYVWAQKCQSGILAVYSPHTTAGISVNENYDPDVKRDITHYLNKTIPRDFGFRHGEGNSDSHIKGALINFSQVFIIEDGRIQLGQWQGIFFMEFDGPRSRQIWVKILNDQK